MDDVALEKTASHNGGARRGAEPGRTPDLPAMSILENLEMGAYARKDKSA